MDEIPTIDSSMCFNVDNGSSSYVIDDLDGKKSEDLESIIPSNFLEDKVINDVGVSPPTNLNYTFLNDEDFRFKEKYAIEIYWTDPSASIQDIEIYRSDIPSLVISKQAPTTSTTTKNWLNISIFMNLEWSTNYYYNLRTIYQFSGTSKTYSDWVQLSVFKVNDELRRKNDKCAIETLKSLEVRLNQNLNEIPKSFQYSKIIKSRKNICQTWRPQGWNDGSFPKEDYPITLAEEEKTEAEAEAEAEAEEFFDNSICGTCSSNNAIISKYTGKLIFGTAAVEFKEGFKTTNLKQYPCGKLRKIGGKLPIN